MDNKTSANRLAFLDYYTFLDTKLPEKLMIMSPWLGQGSLNMIYAKRGIGKTYLCLALAKAISSGRSILNWECELPYRVAYFDGEMQADSLQKRWASIHSEFEPLTGYLKVITPDLHQGAMPDISNQTWHKDIIEKASEFDVVIFDSLSTLARTSKKENDADSWTEIQYLLLSLRKLGKSVIIVHHSGKNNDQRGTSKKEDIMDTVIKLSRSEDYNSIQGARFQVEYTKARHFAGEDAEGFEAILEKAPTGLFFKSEKLANKRTKAKELKANGMKKAEIAKQLNVDRSTVTRWFDKK